MRRNLLLGALLAFCVAFAAFAISRILPPEPYGLADDWRVFFAATHTAMSGASPYDPVAIHTAEQSAQFYPSVQPSLDDFTDLPVVALVLRLVTWLPYWWSFAVFTACGLLAMTVALRGWVRDVGWTKAGTWLLAAACSWPALLGFFSGQFDALLVAATAGSLLLMRRHRPWLSALCMGAVLLKPHLLWPLPLLIAVTWQPPRERLKFLAGTAFVLIGGVAAGFALVPGSSQFFSHLLGFGSRVSSVQPDLSGLPGLAQHLPGGSVLAVAIAGLGVIAVLAIAVVAARNTTTGFEMRATYTLLALATWLACAPYAHPNDDVLLFPLVAVLIGVNAERLEPRGLMVGFVTAAAVAAAFIASPVAGYVSLAAGIAALALRRPKSASVSAIALVCLVLLPTVWPFHLLSVPITPIAVGLVAYAGALHLRWQRRNNSVRQGQRSGRILSVVVEPSSALSAQAAGTH